MTRLLLLEFYWQADGHWGGETLDEIRAALDEAIWSDDAAFQAHMLELYERIDKLHTDAANWPTERRRIDQELGKAIEAFCNLAEERRKQSAARDRRAARARQQHD